MMMYALRRSSVKRAFCRRSFWTSSSIGCAWTATLGQSFEDSLGPLSPPVSQQRRVQTFAAEKGAKALASSQRLRLLVRCVVCIRCVGPPLRFGNYFGTRPRSRHRIGARFGCRRTPRQPNPPGKQPHRENSRSSLSASFSPYCSLIKGTSPSFRVIKVIIGSF